MSEIELPKLGTLTTFGGERGFIIHSKDKPLTKDQAAEAIRRTEAYPGLAEAIKELIHRLKWVTQEEDEQRIVNESIKQAEQALAGEKDE